MTIGSLWLPSLSVPASGPVPTLRGQSALTNTGGDSFSVTLPVTTNAGDCIILAAADSFGQVPAASGAGATWTVVGAGTTGLGLVIGYNCSASQTTMTLSNMGGGINTIVVSVWSHIATTSPVTGSNNGHATSVNNVTSGSITYSAGQLIIGAGFSNNSTSLTPTWSSGATNTNVNSDLHSVQISSLDYYIAGASGSTTLKEQGTGSGTIGAALAALTPGS